MTPTPPSVDAVSSASPHSEDRTRRNVACVNCRNSKVRCRSSTVPGQPCQRCAKLHLSCVVDKFHKRVTKRSKLELLEEELRNIKEVVNPRTAAGETTTWTPPSPRQPYPGFAESNHANHAPSRPLSSAIPQAPTPSSEPPAVVPPSAQVTERRPKTGATQSRVLGDHVVSGEDIDWYFNKFLQCLHPFLPILAKRDPDECFEASPTLFWVILYITCRRYTKDRVFFQALVDHIETDIWKAVSAAVVTMETVHAVLFLCAWPLPSLRLLVDPSAGLISLTQSGAMGLGMHTGRGSSKEFCVGARRECVFTDEEAASTWFACCTLATKIAVHSGIAPMSIHLDDTQCRASLESPFWNDLVSMYDLSKFLSRMHTAVAAQLSSHREIPHTMVSAWEQEFEALRPTLIQTNTDANTFHTIAAHLEIQTYYFSGPRTTPEHTQRLNFTRAFHTSRTLVATALDLENRTQFLTHAPQQAFRALTTAACIVIAILYSTSAPDMAPNEANVLAQQALAAVHRCSVQEGDLAHRFGVIIETFWSFKHYLPRFEVGPRCWPGRFGVGLVIWCLDMFKNSLHRAQKNAESAGGGGGGANRAQEAGSPNAGPNSNNAQPGTASAAAAQANQLPPLQQQQQQQPYNQMQAQPQHQMNLGSDPFQEIDWSMFMDDFGWVGDDGVMLGLP